MTRLPRPAFAGATYHVTAHGIHGADIFTDDYDRYAYLALAARAVRLMQVRIFAYALMDTHVHLVLQTAHPNISVSIQRLHGRYAYAFNRREGRRGHLFESRFRCKLIEDNTYFLEATRYSHLNPVRAGLVNSPEEFPWTSYRYYVASEQQAGQTLVDVRPVLALFSLDSQLGRAAYQRFVLAGLEASAVSGSDKIGDS